MIALSAIYIQQQGWNDTLIQCVESYIESTRTSFCTDTFSQVLDLYQSIESGVLYQVRRKNPVPLGWGYKASAALKPPRGGLASGTNNEREGFLKTAFYRV